MKKVILTILVILSSTSLCAEDYFQWVKDTYCTELIFWRCAGLFCVALVAADKVIPFAQKKINTFRGIKEETYHEACERRIAKKGEQLNAAFNNEMQDIRLDLNNTKAFMIKTHADLIQLIDDKNENNQLVFAKQDALTHQKNDLMVEINAIKKIIEERNKEKKLSFEMAQELVVQRRQKIVKEFRDETYSKQELNIVLEAIKKECQESSKKILVKTKKIAKRHLQFFQDNQNLMREIVDLKKEYAQTKELVDIFAQESNALVFKLPQWKSRALQIENSLNQLETPKSTKKASLSRLKKKQGNKKRRNSWSDGSNSNPNTPRSKTLEEIVISPRPQTPIIIRLKNEGEKEL